MKLSYRVHFTSGLFRPTNVLFRDIVSKDIRGPEEVDRGLLKHHPRLLEDVSDYMDMHDDAMSLAGEPILVEGGESAKNDPNWVDAIHKAVDAARLCRHSYVVAVGGG